MKTPINYRTLSNYSLGQRVRYGDHQAALELKSRELRGDYTPQKTVKAYKLFRTNHKGELFPLFVNADKPTETGKWLEAESGPINATGKVKSKIGELAYRPGWHAGNYPIATHIGGKSKAGLTAPDHRPDNQVWAEVEMADDHDWQSEANKRAKITKKGTPDSKTAHITDQVPLKGHYRYKTNPNMTGEWLIGGHMKINRVLTDDEVEKINSAAGLKDLPRIRKTINEATEDYTYHADHSRRGVLAKHKGKNVGSLTIWKEDGKYSAAEVAVHAAHRRKGVATGMYREAEKHFGELHPSSALSDDGHAFWSKYRPEAVKNDLRNHKHKLMGKETETHYGKGTITSVGRAAAIATLHHNGNTAPVKKDHIQKLISEDYPLAHKDKDGWYSDGDYEARGGKMTHMHPDEYLKKVRPLKIDDSSRENIDDLKNHIKAGRKLDPLKIYADGKEDGRHRAHAAKELGIKKVPVVEFPRTIKEWLELTEMAPPHVERDEIVRHLIKHKLPIKRRESSKISDSEYLHVDVGDEHDEYGDKIGDKLIKVRISDHRATRHAIQKHGAAHVEIGPHGYSVQHGLKKILQHAGINEMALRNTDRVSGYYHVLRLGHKGDDLKGRNAGNHIGLARHLGNIDDYDKPSYPHGDHVNVYRVKSKAKKGKYVAATKHSEDESDRVGVDRTKWGKVWYSFGKKAPVKHKLIKSIPLQHIRDHLKAKHDQKNFDAASDAQGADAIHDMVKQHARVSLKERAIMYHGARINEAWKKPVGTEEHDEVDYQRGEMSGGMRKQMDKMSSVMGYRSAMRKAQVKLVSPHEAKTGINNTGENWHSSNNSVKHRRVQNLFKSGRNITTPVVLHNKTTGEKHLLGGHHRLTYNSQMRNKATPVSHVEFHEAVQHINYQMLSNYSLGQRARYNDQLAVLEIARRKRLADHQFQHHPSQQPRALIQNRDETIANPTALGAKTEWLRTKIDTVADALNFPRDRIHMSDQAHMFNLNGRLFKADGVYYPGGDKELGIQPGHIVIYGNPNFDNDKAVRGLTAHEIMHAKFDKVMKEYRKEYDQFQAEQQWTKYFDNNGKLKSVFRHQFPIRWALDKTSLLHDGKKLATSDGVTNYSAEYWMQFDREPGQIGFNTAINETLAEIANLHMEYGLAKKMSPKSRYKKIDEFLPKYFRQQRKERGDAFATEYELEGILSDPWAWLDLVDTEIWKKDFGFEGARDLRISHTSKEASVFSFMPMKVIKPEWRKLYDTIITLYDKMKDK